MPVLLKVLSLSKIVHVLTHNRAILSTYNTHKHKTFLFLGTERHFVLQSYFNISDLIIVF